MIACALVHASCCPSLTGFVAIGSSSGSVAAMAEIAQFELVAYSTVHMAGELHHLYCLQSAIAQATYELVGLGCP